MEKNACKNLTALWLVWPGRLGKESLSQFESAQGRRDILDSLLANERERFIVEQAARSKQASVDLATSPVADQVGKSLVHL